MLSLTVPAYHSLPSATVKLYLDFDGDYTATWGGYAPGTTPAYSTDADTANFSSGELANIAEIFNRVAEKFSPFNIDVTTVDPGSYTDKVAERIVIGGAGAWYEANQGGVNALGGFANSGPNTGFVFSANHQNGNPRLVAEAVVHETGHAFGLEHQSEWIGSTKVQEYSDNDPATTDFSSPRYTARPTAPIMGYSYDAQRSLWWTGTPSSSSTATQNDLSIITNSTNGITYRSDDYGNAWNSTTGSLTSSGTSLSGSGVITTTSDWDYFSFTVPGMTADVASVTFTISPSAYGGMLDSVAKIVDANGNQVVFGTLGLETKFVVTLLPGTYYLGVSSQGNYGDIGQYTISGTILTPVLSVGGTSGNDTITVSPISGGYSVVKNGSAYLYYGAFVGIFVSGGSGNDTITISSSITLPTTVSGGAGNDTIYGGSGNDLLLGGDDDDLIYGGAGNDSIEGGNGNDTVRGGLDNDDISGGAGIDTIDFSGMSSGVNISLDDVANDNDSVGTADNIHSDIEVVFGTAYGDSLSGGSTSVTLNGGAGNDSIYGSSGNDVLNGGDNDDLIYGGAGNDTIYGGNGNDTMRGGSGNDVLAGEGGNDTALYGAGWTSALRITLDGVANDREYTDPVTGLQDVDNIGADIETVIGGDGNDEITGSGANNFLSGGGGNDTIAGGAGTDTLDGGAGTDTVSYAYLTTFGVTASVGTGTTTGSVYNGGTLVETDSLTGFENITGGGGSDVLSSSLTTGSRLEGGASNDKLYGGSGNDTLLGGDDDDEIYGGAGDDAIYGGNGNDTMRGGSGNDVLAGEGGNDTALYGAGWTSALRITLDGVANDREYTDPVTGLQDVDNIGADIETVIGGDGNDEITGSGANNFLSGGGGNDTIAGGAGTDTLDGGAGWDVVTVAATATAVFNSSQTLASLVINNGALAVLALNGSRLLTLKGLTISSQGTLDLKDNDLAFDYTGSTTVASVIRTYLINGFNSGNWNGYGIITSVAGTYTTLGYLDDSANSIVRVKFTYIGDADLNGVVNSADATLLYTGYGNPALGNTWHYGDFNYDGVVTGDDIALYDAALLAQGAPL